jgi:hypothetical protein
LLCKRIALALRDASHKQRSAGLWLTGAYG